MPKVSIIVPIYNVEKYIRDCLDSIINQTLQDIEIILVNDGSPDNCLSICNEYTLKDSRVKVIDKKNGGVSSARNSGLEAATGEYIGFVDPDDKIEAVMYENMYNKAKANDSDICMCTYLLEKINSSVSVELDIEKNILTKDEILKYVTMPMLEEGKYASLCMSIYKNELINKNKLQFRCDIGEDLLFNFKVRHYARTLCIDKSAYYHVFVTQESITRGYRERLWDTCKEIAEEIKKFCAKNNMSQELGIKIDTLLARYSISAVLNECKSSNNRNTNQVLKVIRDICKDKDLKLGFKAITRYNMPRGKKAILLLMSSRLIYILYLLGKYYSAKRLTREER